MKLLSLHFRRVAVLRLCVLIFFSASLVDLASAAPFYASALVDSQFVTPFGSGFVTGPPDGGGLFLSDTFDPPTNLGHVTVEFPSAAGDGPGPAAPLGSSASASTVTRPIASPPSEAPRPTRNVRRPTADVTASPRARRRPS